MHVTARHEVRGSAGGRIGSNLREWMNGRSMHIAGCRGKVAIGAPCPTAPPLYAAPSMQLELKILDSVYLARLMLRARGSGPTAFPLHT